MTHDPNPHAMTESTHQSQPYSDQAPEPANADAPAPDRPVTAPAPAGHDAPLEPGAIPNQPAGAVPPGGPALAPSDLLEDRRREEGKAQTGDPAIDEKGARQ